VQMPLMSIYCTPDSIGTETGSGAVTLAESDALSQLGFVYPISRKTINPDLYKIQKEPFAFDYIADSLVSRLPLKMYKLAHFYSGSFSKTIQRLKNEGLKIVYSVDAHDTKVSREEFESCGLEYNFPHLVYPNLWRVYIEGYVNSDAVICSSTSGEKIMKGIGCKNTIVIPHGVNMTRFSLAKTLDQIAEFNVGYLGQSGPDKGVRYLTKAWKKLGLRDSRLRLAGREMKSIFESLLRQEGSEYIDVYGEIPEVVPFYEELSVVLAPSVTEGFNLEVLEAMACGRPVIVTEGTGAKDVVTDGLDGFVVPIRDPDAIANRILYLKENRELLIEMGKAAKRKAEKYSWNNIYPMLQQVWRNLVP
jgi:glycosyltransferase involved in cell wall biosynthesis